MEYLFFPFLATIWLSFLAIGILAFVFWILMLIDCAKRKFKQETDKIIWIVIIAIAGVIGAAVYYFVIKRPNKH